MSETTTVTFTVLGTQPVRGAGRLVGLANVEVVLDGVAITLQGIGIMRERDGNLTCKAPVFRYTDGTWLPAVVLPPELGKAIAAEVLGAFR